MNEVEEESYGEEEDEEEVIDPNEEREGDENLDDEE